MNPFIQHRWMHADRHQKLAKATATTKCKATMNKKNVDRDTQVTVTMLHILMKEFQRNFYF